MAHHTTEELTKILNSAKSEVNIGEIYQHYKTKGNYTVEAVALQESTEEPCVIYRSASSPELLWVRDVKVWNEVVKDDDGYDVKRFSPIRNG